MLDLPRPEPAKPDASENAYTFDRAIIHAKADGTIAPRYIDLYKAGNFVLETKQGVEAETVAGASAPVAGLSEAGKGAQSKTDAQSGVADPGGWPTSHSSSSRKAATSLSTTRPPHSTPPP
ncbi:MAG: hypothetical protein MI807_08080 [Verrucomicrobiales bacterium]|nr:hypothetical protein [Verrucomicrobiales bacterium]